MFQAADFFCFVGFRAAYPCKVPYFLAVVAFYRFSRTVVLGCPVLPSAESTVVFLLFLLFLKLVCLDCPDEFLIYLSVFRQCGLYGGLFMSAVVAVLCDKFYGGF